MNYTFSVQHLTETGHEIMLTKYFSGSISAFLLHEYFLTLPDEVRYVWGGRKSWIFYLFLYNRYMPIIFKACTTLSVYYSGYTQERRVLTQRSANRFPNIYLRCDKTAFLALIFIVTSTLVTQIFLTLRLYGLSQRSKLALTSFSALSLAQLIFGTVMISSPSNSGMEFPDIPLDAFHLCLVKTEAFYEIAYVGLSLFFDLATFVTIFYYATRSKSQYGMPYIIRTVLEDTTIYSFVMALCNLILVLFVIFAKAPIKLLPATGSIIFMPVLATRLVLSLKKAADPESDIEWGVDHFMKRVEPQPAPHPRPFSFELQPRARSSVGARGPD